MKGQFFLPFFAFTLIICSCSQKNKKETQQWNTKKLALENQAHNQLLDIEKEQGWQLLFDGNTLDGWHLYNKPDSTLFSAWEVKDGLLHCDAANENKVFGDLITNTAYENYELVFEWQMALRGNGGVFINVQESPAHAATYRTGPEYQLLEPAHSDTQTPKKKAGSLWGVSEQTNPTVPKPAGQWNLSKIIQKDGKVEFYLNGVLTAKEDFNSSEWKAKLNDSNFSDNPDFGKVTKGKIALQNWYFDSWFRNMKIREL
ncbi:3-keto-disaccharide hydrolase [Croceivirga thetidis]|uniref:DUF1080 domain-containing protein n=1 Tax=Croceivirga thetidis TaxID=2721623 RepID=A0ABX1GST4_9FLAO|nr:DUF1080 domain-containing protein [Croceivirga thetidis]NKI33024.1 DUF1080 domain-containing protein [Croceivirga thetidis]